MTNGDIGVQNFILKTFLDNGFADCQIFAEENEESALYLDRFAKDSKNRIFIDPIDGTLSYALGHPDTNGLIKKQFGENGCNIVKRVNLDNYGILLGFESDKQPTFAVGGLPVKKILYYSSEGQSYRNGKPFYYQQVERTIDKKIFLRPTLVHFDYLFTNAGFEVLYFNGPGALYWILEENFNGLVAKSSRKPNDYPWQIQAMIAKNAGLIVVDEDMKEFPIYDFGTPKKSLVIARDQNTAETLANILKKIK